MKNIISIWNKNILNTSLQGTVNLADIEVWEQSIKDELRKMPYRHEFKLLVNQLGYYFEDIQVHKKMRIIIPTILAEHYFILTHVDKDAFTKIDNSRNIRCIAVAIVHHDEYKMSELEKQYGKDNERYFNDYIAAENWLRNYKN